MSNTMKFKTTEELLEFMNTIDLDQSTLVFKGEVKVTENEDCGCDGSATVCSCETVEIKRESTATLVDSSHALVESFSDAPKFKVVVSEADENVFYVKDYEAQRDACGTGSITLEDRITYMNMCEMNDTTTVTLDIVTEGKKLKGMPFKLIKTEGESYLQVSKNQLL